MRRDPWIIILLPIPDVYLPACAVNSSSEKRRQIYQVVTTVPVNAQIHPAGNTVSNTWEQKK